MSEAVEHHKKCESALKGVYGKNGLLEQARAAQAGGTIAEFFKNLLAQFGPLIGPLLLSLLSGLLNLPTPISLPSEKP